MANPDEHAAVQALTARWNVNEAHTAVDHSLGLRAAAGVSSDCMNRVYDKLRMESDGTLGLMWDEADPWTPMGALLRHQIAFVMLKRRQGQWLPDND